MKRILRLLLIAAVAWPLCQPAVAQEVMQSQNPKKILQKESVDIGRLPASEAKLSPKDLAQEKPRQQQTQNVNVKATLTETEIVCEGTSTDSHFPLNGGYFDYGTNSQMIYPASLFEKLNAGDKITSLTFFAREALDSDLANSTVKFRLGETSSATVTSAEMMSTNTTTYCNHEIFSGNIPTGSNTLTIDFSNNPYTYNGGNLIIDTEASASGQYAFTYWYGVTSSNSSFCTYYNSSSATSPTSSQGSFLPKMEISYTYEPEPYAATLIGDGAFGDVNKNQTASKTFTVKNKGENAFTPVLTSSDPAFTVSSSESGSLASGASRSYTVTFAPTVLQAYSGTLTLTAEESEASAINATVELSGNGTRLQDVVVANGEETNSYVPVYPYYMESVNHGQIIYPADELNLTPGSKISSITFHANTTLHATSGSIPNTVTLKLGETDNDSYGSSTAYLTNLTEVASVSTIFTESNTVTFTFTTPYEYQGGNLVVDASSAAQSDGYWSNGISWLGETSTGASIHMYSTNSVTQRDFLPKMTMKVEMAAGEETLDLDFGMINVGSSKTMTAFVGNTSDQPVTATVTATAPFSVANSTVTLNASEDGTTPIEVTFTPTQPSSYHSTLTIVAGDMTKTIQLMGVGNQDGVPCTRDSAFYAGIEYKWPINSANQQTSSLDEIATDPDQIIAMLREVYMNKSIPGNLKRGFTTTGAGENYDDVYYSGIGKVNHTGSVYNNASYYSYNDSYGWSIPGDVKYGSMSYAVGDNTYNAYYAHLDTVQYKPNQEGVTLLLLEMVDDYDHSSISMDETTSYESLRTYIANSIKSARIVTDSKRTGNRSDFSSGTLFKIDCDKMNKFFLLAKGQLRWFHDSYYAPWVNNAGTEYNFAEDACAPPCYLYTASGTSSNATVFTNGYFEDFSVSPFYHMFEQFSPVADDATAAKSDIYQDLINMESFGVEHDCMGVTHQGHQFQMYGNESSSADCQDVRDMMFFVPDYRMMYWENLTDTIGRDVIYKSSLTVANTQKFRNYNLDHQPTMGLYVIRQNDIIGEQTTYNSSDEYYKLHLTWDSNLLDFLPDGNGIYTLYRVTYDDNGNKVYTEVATLDQNTLSYYDYVQMEESSQEVTYVVRGQDSDKFLSLQMSNEKSYIIPGLDPSEMVMLNDATHYSRYNPQTEKNCYSNKIVLNNNAMGLNHNNITSSTQLTLNRIYTEMVDGVSTIITKPVANITFNAGSKTMTVTMDNQSPSSEYPNGKTSGLAAGYHANPGETTWTIDYTVVESGSNAGNLIFSLPIFDNFTVDVSNNEHPASYAYGVESNYDASASSTSVYLNAAACTTGEEIWYAWTWNNDNDGKWVKGITQGNLLKFVAVKNNMLFVRMDAHPAEGVVIPSWAAEWNRTPENVSTVGNIGKTYTIGWYNDGSGKIWGQWSNDVMPEYAHSNSTRIPVYKTGSQMTAFNEQEVLDDEDGYMELPNKVIFDVDVQEVSKTELLRYDAYRWKNTAANQRFIIDVVGEGDDEEDIAPNGIAGNQGTNYSVSMNAVGSSDYISSTASLTNGWGVAHFEDVVPAKNTTAAIFDYAPVVETFASAFDKTREDYNTYGGPMQSTATAKAVISVVQPNEDYPLMSTHTWKKTVNGVEMKYAYYNINVNVDTKDIPNGYDIYMIRAWREIDESLLGEEYEEMESRISGDILFEEIKYPDYDKNDTYVLGSKPETVEVEGADGQNHSYRCFKGTFGAQKLRTSEGETGVIDELEALFTVRIYFTKNENLPQTQSEVSGAPVLRDGVPTAGDGKFYVVEAVVDKTFKSNEVVTGIIQNLNTREAIGVKYYNPAGIESDTPFKGVNIVVTRYSDGSTTTTKILK